MTDDSKKLREIMFWSDMLADDDDYNDLSPLGEFGYRLPHGLSDEEYTVAFIQAALDEYKSHKDLEHFRLALTTILEFTSGREEDDD